MVLGFGALASLGLALPTGLAFGYGYGYGVRQGYSAFKPPGKTANNLKLSANPVTGALGAGLQSAEERTGVKNLGISTIQGEPDNTSISQSSDKLVTTGTPQEREWISNKDGSEHITRAQKNEMSREEYKRWFHKTSYTSRRTRR